MSTYISKFEYWNRFDYKVKSYTGKSMYDSRIAVPLYLFLRALTKIGVYEDMEVKQQEIDKRLTMEYHRAREETLSRQKREIIDAENARRAQVELQCRV